MAMYIDWVQMVGNGRVSRLSTKLGGHVNPWSTIEWSSMQSQYKIRRIHNWVQLFSVMNGGCLNYYPSQFWRPQVLAMHRAIDKMSEEGVLVGCSPHWSSWKSRNRKAIYFLQSGTVIRTRDGVLVLRCEECRWPIWMKMFLIACKVRRRTWWICMDCDNDKVHN